MIQTDLPEPWLRGTLTDVPSLQRAVLHALELAREDLERWCGGMTDEELNERPDGIAPVVTTGGAASAGLLDETAPAAAGGRSTDAEVCGPVSSRHASCTLRAF